MPIFYAKAIDLKLVPDNLKAFLHFLEDNDKKSLIVTIERETGVRSYNQNNWLWGMVYKPIADYTGHTEDDIHEYCKRHFLPPVYKTILGKEMKLPSSTTTLNKVEFGEYVEKIRAMAGEMGIVIPDPIKDIAKLK